MQKICIIGGGLTGLTTALILSKLNAKVDLVAKFEPSNRINDNRTTAISPSNYKSLCSFLSLEDQKIFWPSTNIDLYHEQSDKYHHFMNFKNNGKNIIYILENKKLIKAIVKKIKSRNKIKIINKEVKKIDEKNSEITFKNKKKKYDIIILCTGKKSFLVTNLIGKRIISGHPNDIAFTSIVKHNLNINNSKQYFLKEGPMAILPINKKQFSLVWSVSKNLKLETIKNLINHKFKKIFGSNRKLKISKFDFFPISFSFNVNFFKKNVLVLGESSYNVHPIAGQGFNMILRDILNLNSHIKEHLELGIQLKDSRIFNRFVSSRKPENLLFGLSINLIHEFFRNNKISNSIKKIILNDLNDIKFLKKLNLRIADTGIF